MRPAARPAVVLGILCFLLAAAAPAASPLRTNGDGTVTDLGTGLTWVADRGFAVSSGFARDTVLPRGTALALVAAMNSGRVENFGRTEWRLPTRRELLRMAALTGGLPRPNGGGRVALPGGARDAVAAWPVTGASVLSGVDEVAILATNSVHINRHSQVVGDVVVNDASPGPTLRAGFELGIDQSSTVDGDVAADSVALDRDVEVTGEVAYNALQIGNARTGSLRTPLSLPVFALLPPFQTALPRPDAPNVFVAAGATETLAAGDYGTIEIAATGTLVLSGGVYTVRSIQTVAGSGPCPAPCRSVTFAAATDLRIAERLATGSFAYVGPAVGSGLSASEAILYVGGIDGADGALGSLPRAVAVGRGSTLAANFYAPNGTIHLERDVTAAGTLFASDVLLNQNASVTLDSFYANRAPTAHPQDTFTRGATSLTITLTGSDPDNDDLTFAIVTGPTQGSLDPIVEQPPPGLGDPRRTSATVTYHPTASGDVEDSFTFEVRDPLNATGVATVRINPPDAPEVPPPPPPTTVVALDGAVDTTTDRAVTITLQGAAPVGVALSFGVVAGSGPANGTLGAVVQGSETPQRSATVVYTPATGFTGGDGFDFEACGTIASIVVCDTAHVAITVAAPPAEPSELAPDATVSTPQEQTVQITLGLVAAAGGSSAASAAPRRLIAIAQPAAFIDGAEIAGNVADSGGDGFGDNHNALPGSSPVFISAGVGQSGGAGSNGKPRIHVEWDISSFGGTGTIDSARVTLNTHRGTVDSLDTFFFAGAGGNGTLEDTDFEATVEAVPGAVMPVPPLETLPVGADGTFTFDVTAEFRAALAASATFFTVQGRVDETLAGPARGLEVRSSASGNLASFLEPQLEITTPGVTPATTYTILSLPPNGTLRNSLGAVITATPAVLPDSRVSYLPNTGFIGTESFAYQAELASVVDTGVVTIVVVQGSCLTNPSFCDDGR
jgi:hypothetical protein